MRTESFVNGVTVKLVPGKLTPYQELALSHIRHWSRIHGDTWFRPEEALYYTFKRREFVCRLLVREGYLESLYTTPDAIDGTDYENGSWAFRLRVR